VGIGVYRGQVEGRAGSRAEAKAGRIALAPFEFETDRKRRLRRHFCQFVDRPYRDEWTRPRVDLEQFSENRRRLGG
jgi:hypothetical protein